MEHPVEQSEINGAEALHKGFPHIPEGAQSYATIDAVFRNAPMVPSGGGFPGHRKPYYKGDETHKISEDHHVKTYFSDEEMPYINATVAYLNLLANGYFFGEAQEAPKPLSNKIVNRYMEQIRSPSYNKAVDQGIFDLLDEFQKRYPNLMPALRTLYLKLGAHGTGIAIARTIGDLERVMAGEINKDDIKRMVIRPRKEFIGFNREYNESWRRTGKTYERWCTGQAFARTIAQQSLQAALEIAETPQADNYSYQNETDVGIGKKDIVNHVEVLYQQTAQQQASSNA